MPAGTVFQLKDQGIYSGHVQILRQLLTVSGRRVHASRAWGLVHDGVQKIAASTLIGPRVVFCR